MRTRVIIVILLLFMVGAYVLLDVQQWLNLNVIKQQQAHWVAQFHATPLRVALGFGLGYVLVTAASLPGAALLSLAGGAILGFGPGLLVISFASSLGATLAFLISRTVLRTWLEQRFAASFARINAGVIRDGAFYLLSLRLVPLFPFFVINLLMGLTRMRTWSFYWVSQLGMLPATAVYVNAGTQLGQIEQLADVATPPLILSLTLLGLLPLISRHVLNKLKRRRALSGWPRPKHFDYNVVVIGGGAGGLVSAYITSAAKAKVALIEQHQMGGDCLNSGCVPSKALIRAAKSAHEMRHSARFGIHGSAPQVDFQAVMAHIKAAIARIEPHDSRERYTQLGVDCFHGTATMRSPWQVEVNGQLLTTRSVIIATGARPRVPELPGLLEVPYFTSDTLWGLTELPQRLVILGGGPIGCEMAQAWARLGSQVTLIEAGGRLLNREDPEVSTRIREQLIQEGVDVRLNARATATHADSAAHKLWLEGNPQPVLFTHLLLALGRIPHLAGLGLAQLGIEPDAASQYRVDNTLQLGLPNLWVVGDAAGGDQFTHAAAQGAFTVSLNALFGHLKTFRTNWRVLPRVTFTDPEVARVGLNVTAAVAQDVPHEVTTYALDALDRAITEGDQGGWIQVLTRPGSDQILGATVVSPQAGEMITEWVSAMKHKQGLNRMLSTIHAYPTRSEGNKAVAGVWKKARQPERVLAWLQRYHQWRR